MMTPKLLTIHGETRSIAEWSRQPGAARYITIVQRLLIGRWPPERAVFAPKHTKLRYTRAVRVKRAEPTLPSSPAVANPLRPCIGSVRSYSLEHLELLRRVA